MRGSARAPRMLDELTFEEARDFALVSPVTLLPVGATEAHGPHLPLGTDVFISAELARRAALRLEDEGRTVFIAPTLSYAVTEFGAAFAGTVSIGEATATALIQDVLSGLARGGFKRVCLVNSHLEPAHVATLRAACAVARGRSGCEVAFPDHTERRFARLLTEEYRRGNCHAGRYETSLMLAARPDLVRGALSGSLPRNESDFLAALRGGARTFEEAGGPRAYFGDPAAASAEEGDEIYGILVEMVVQAVKETWPAPV